MWLQPKWYYFNIEICTRLLLKFCQLVRPTLLHLYFERGQCDRRKPFKFCHGLTGCEIITFLNMALQDMHAGRPSQ